MRSQINPFEVLHAQARDHSLGRRRWMPNFHLLVVVWSFECAPNLNICLPHNHCEHRDCNHYVLVLRLIYEVCADKEKGS
jgi:hypothetical protein